MRAREAEVRHLKGRNILVACQSFGSFSGSEIICVELAESMIAAGADVTIAALTIGGPIDAWAARAGARVVGLDQLVGRHFDLAWIHHWPVWAALSASGIAAERAVFSSLSPYEPRELPPLIGSGIDLYVANSEETRARLVNDYGLPPTRVLVFPNSAPTAFFEVPTVAHADQLARVAVVSNHVPPEVEQLVVLLGERGIAVEVIGESGRFERVTFSLLREFDATVSIGKTVQYCLASRVPVFVYDRFGGPGWLTEENWELAERYNYSGRCTRSPRPASALLTELITGFRGAFSRIEFFHALARERYSFEANLASVLHSVRGSETAVLPQPTEGLVRAHVDAYARLQAELTAAHLAGRARESDRVRAWQRVAELESGLASLSEEHGRQLAKILADHQMREDDRVAAWKAAQGFDVAVRMKDEQLGLMSGELEQLRNRYASDLQSKALLGAELASRQAELDGCREQLQAARAEADAMRTQLASMQHERDAEAVDLGRQIGELSARCLALESELAVLTEGRDRAAREAATQGEQVATLRANGERLAAELKAAQRRADLAEQASCEDRHRAQAGNSQLAALRGSRSWRITAPLRSLGSAVRWLRDRLRRTALQSGRAIWRRLPLDRRAREALKATAFPLLAPFIGRTALFRQWQEHVRVHADFEAARRATAANAGSASAAVTMVGAPREAGLPAIPEPVPVPLCRDAPLTSAPVTLVAFYLPQFHPIPENDTWWGPGFTEWTNVTRATPQFAGHYQPHVPGELGYYDLRVPEVQRRQVELAKLYGVGAFCFYFYWFAGHRLLERPVLQYLNDSTLDLPFCLCWANENWSRRWDGLDQELLISQKHSPDDDLAFIAYLARYLRDERYLRVAGRPLVLVYRPDILPDARATAERWRSWCRTHGVGEIFLAYTQSFSAVDPAEYGFDAAIEFPPNNCGPPDITDQIQRLNPSFSGVVYDWRVLVERSRHYVRPDYRLYRGVNPSWDNEARKTGRGAVLFGSSPAAYREWVRNAALDTLGRFARRDERLVFVNAWNEWAEGAHLEPDRRYGYAWLQATRDGLLDAVDLADTGRHGGAVAGSGGTAWPATADAGHAGRRMVLVTHDAYPHGAQFLALHLAEAFVEHLKATIDIVVLGDGPLKADFARYGTVHDLAGVDPEGQQALALAGRLRAEGATAALCNTAVSGRFLSTLKAAGIRCVSLIHEMPGVIESFGLGSSAAVIAREADCIVFPAEVVAAGFARFAAVRADRVRVRPQGLYKHNRFAGDEGRRRSRTELRERLGLPANARIVLGVGYADHRKGIDLFVAAGAELMAQRDDVWFVWVGHHDASVWPDIEARVAATGRRERFVFPGRQADTDAFYAGADVFALTSREDPFPSVVMESLEVEVPVVAFAGSGGCCDMLAAGAGLLVDGFDVRAFSAAVQRLLDEPVLASQLGKQGAQQVREAFSFRRYVFDLAAWLQIGLRRVSVVVPNYNYANYIEERLASIAGQTYPVYEVIVLDDASTDDSSAVIERALERLPIDSRFVANASNSGSVFSQWRKGAEMAGGDLIWIAEADDLADTDFLAATVNAFADPRVVLSYCQSRQVATDGALLCEHYRDYTMDISSDKWLAAYVADGVSEIRSALAVKNTIPNVSAVVFRREALLGALSDCADRLARLRVAGDWMVYVSVLTRGSIAFSPASLNSHRRHTRSVTLSNFNLVQLVEIVEMQRYIRSTFGTEARTAQTAKAYAQSLFVQFGLATDDLQFVDRHPALSHAFEG